MRYILVLIAGFLTLQGLSQPKDMKVMTFNIRYDNPDDGNYRWSLRKPLVRDLLDSEQPQVACFQEVLAGQMKDLSGMLPGYAWYGVGRDDGKESGEFSPVFYDTLRFRLLSGTTQWLSEKPTVPGSRSWGAACTRIVTRVILYDRSWRDTVFVYNTHFDHISQPAREKSAGMIAGNILEIKGQPHVIVTGDFNDTLRSSALKSLFDAGLQQAVPMGTKTPDGPDFTFAGFPFTPHPGEMIDFILTGPSLRKSVVVSYINPLNRNGYYPSDHLPVIAIFSPPETKP